MRRARQSPHCLFDKPQQALNYHGIPTAVFSQPPVASVGLSETDARETYAAVDVYQAHFKPMAFSLSDTDERTFIKLVVDRHTDKVIGCHMLGPDAAEIMQGLAVALTAGATKQDFDRTIGIHPTLAEEFVTLRERHTANPDWCVENGDSHNNGDRIFIESTASNCVF